MERRILCAGFGGQGVLAMGQMIAYAGMIENYQVTWMPSYGPEMRGGAANCSVVVADSDIGAPNIDTATDVVVMNQPSFDKFKDRVKEGGNLFINTSLVKEHEFSNDKINIYHIPATGKAVELGNAKMANMVMLGSILEVTELVKLDSIIKAFEKVFGDKKKKLIPMNKVALDEGMKLARSEEKPVTEDKVEGYRKTPESFAKTDDEVEKFKLDYDDSIFESPIKCAKFALDFEKDGKEYYEKIANESDDEYKNIFKGLAEQESEHVKYIEKLIESIEDESSIEDIDLRVSENNFIGDDFKVSDDNLIIRALRNALYIESTALEFYKKASEKVACDKSKKVYKALIKWEEYHYDQIYQNTKLHQDSWWADQSFSRM